MLLEIAERVAANVIRTQAKLRRCVCADDVRLHIRRVAEVQGLIGGAHKMHIVEVVHLALVMMVVVVTVVVVVQREDCVVVPSHFVDYRGPTVAAAGVCVPQEAEAAAQAGFSVPPLHLPGSSLVVVPSVACPAVTSSVPAVARAIAAATVTAAVPLVHLGIVAPAHWRAESGFTWSADHALRIAARVAVALCTITVTIDWGWRR